MPGYKGQVTLVSPAGETASIVLPGRYKGNPWQEKLVQRQRGKDRRVVTDQFFYYRPEQKMVEERTLRRFYRLLSAGWKVVQPGAPVQDQVGEEQKKNTDQVDGSTKKGNASHGGDHASQEVKDSPNRAKRGCRGGRKPKGPSSQPGQRQPKSRTTHGMLALKGQVMGGGGTVYSPTPIRVTPEVEKSAAKSAELLLELVGRSQLKTRQGVTVNAERLLVALETGDNPLPPLEAPRERPKIRVLVSPDVSGSCQSWSDVGQAWALRLSQVSDVDILYVENANGEFWLGATKVTPSQQAELLGRIDTLIYLGDDDGRNLCCRYAEMGATVIALDNYAACVAKPRLRKDSSQPKNLSWVDRVSAKDPDTWFKALKLVLG